MNQTASVKLHGRPATLDPGLFTDVLFSDGAPTTQESFSTYNIDADVGSPFVVPFGSIAAAKRLIVKVLADSKPVVLHVTSSYGVDQKLSMSGDIAIYNPAVPITALKISGTGTVAVYLAA